MIFYVKDNYTEEEGIIKADSKAEALKKIIDHFKDHKEFLEEMIEFLKDDQDLTIVDIDSLEEYE